jgi:DNA processing protein
MNGPLDEAERICRLRLARSENVGPILFGQLLGRFGTAAAAIEAIPGLARRGGRAKPLKVCPHDRAMAEIEALADMNARYIVRGEADYPIALAAIDDAPPAISVLGDGGLLGERTIAIVGARNASANGRRFAARLAGELGTNDVVVVSGLARGIDAAAHEGALASGTVAVVAGGLDVVYPAENQALFEDIVARGAVVAENALGTVPRAQHFPRRNRIISGLSLGVVVVEAAMRSGSLITARLAGEQGRQVFAVPGSPLDPRAKGVNNLLRQGAVLTESADDILEMLNDMARPTLREEGAGGYDEGTEEMADADPSESGRAAVIEALGASPVAIDEIIRHCGLPASQVSAVLIELELAGRIDRFAGNKVALAG